MVSDYMLGGIVLAALAGLGSARGTPLEARGDRCNADNLLNKFRHTPSVYVPFCQTYISSASLQTVTVTTNFASTAVPTSLPYPSDLSSSSYGSSRLSSACSCLSVPLTTQTATQYIASATASPSSPGYPAIPSGFTKIIFKDDFSTQQPGLLPSQSKWTIDTGVGYPGNDWGWGNQEQESYTAYTDNLVVTANGTLRITPRHVGAYWYSARIETNAASDFSCPAGGKIRVEASLMLGAAPASQQQGIWPAFWMIGTAFRGNWNNWPGVGEIDLMETVNGQGQIYHNVHCGVYPGGPCNEPNGQGATVPFTRGVFHTVSVDIDRTSADWQSQSLTFRIDGVQTFQLPGSTFQTQDVWESLAATPKMILLNVAVGGNWPGYANDQTVDGLPVAMDVKYVVVYSS